MKNPIRRVAVMEIHIPIHEDTDVTEGFPWGYHPVTDTLKMVGIIAEQQHQLFQIYVATRRTLRRQIIIWAVMCAAFLALQVFAFVERFLPPPWW